MEKCYGTTAIDRRSFIRIGISVFPAVALYPLIGPRAAPAAAFALAPLVAVAREAGKFAVQTFCQEIGKTGAKFLAEQFGLVGRKEPDDITAGKSRGFVDTEHPVQVNVSVNSIFFPMAHTDARNAAVPFFNRDSLVLEAIAEGPTLVGMRGLAEELSPAERAGLLYPKAAYRLTPSGSIRRYFPASIHQAARFDQTWPDGIGYRTRDGFLGVYYEVDPRSLTGLVSVALLDASERTIRERQYVVPLVQI